jgi:hypothetical protein
MHFVAPLRPQAGHVAADPTSSDRGDVHHAIQRRNPDHRPTSIGPTSDKLNLYRTWPPKHSPNFVVRHEAPYDRVGWMAHLWPVAAGH